MPHDPLSPSEALRTPLGAVLAAVSLLVFVYSLVIAAQILLGVVVVLALSVGPYLSYRLFAALDSLADGAQRMADAREREARGDGEARFDRPVDRDAAETRERSGERATERER
ncbi:MULTISPECIES: hypothetical protein [Halorubrum]|uniref:Uncharacterized protein n=1 Tax=Halorubrum sodomense TaxID=35743 RepID=A0A1I6HAQ9_HALSD|nr:MULTISPECIES: hypothetical protein [Halorubrum]TKX55846.1 hypothetical protein EXE42_02290 [Halorubrum sp. SP3]TKX71371.1 hypothetical protein EXE45_00410 [Halorubrum sp. SP9]SFR51576.1 hypothetical protein SAMN04487937_2618 [Halorubrum sodomense]